MPDTTTDILRGLRGGATRTVQPAPGTAEPSSVAVWEPGTALPAGALVLGVGVTAADAETVLREAAGAACFGVVLREAGTQADSVSWVELAREAGIALILLRRGASWVTVTQALAAAAGADADAAAAGPPGAAADPDAASDFPRGDLFALADAFADLTGGPTIIEDANFRVLAYSSFTGLMDEGRNVAILGRRMPPAWLAYLEETGSLELLRATAEVIDLASGPWQAHRRLITAVRTETRLLGIIWVAEGGQPLPPHAARALRDAATIAIPHLLRHQEEHRSARRRGGTLVRALLNGQGTLHRQAAELGLPRNAEFAVLAFAPASPDGAGHALTEEQWDRITDHVALSCEAFRWHAAVSWVGTTVFAILALPENGSAEGVLRLGREIVGRSVPALRGHLCGASSTVGRQLGSIHIRRIQAEDALAAVRGRPGAGFARYEDVQPQVILNEIGQILSDRPDLRLPGLEALQAEDIRHGSEYVRTLRVYLSTGCQYQTAADRLGLHVTTLRYRMKRLREISGLDLADAPVRLACELLLATDRPAEPTAR